MSKILVGIRSCCAYKEYRSAQRETWLPALQNLQTAEVMDYKYFVGGTDFQVFEHIIKQEPDVRILAGTDDSLQGLTHKTREMFEYALENGYDHLFFTEDDTYVSPMRLLASGFQYHDYTGNMNMRSNLGFPYMNGHAYWISLQAMELVLNSGCLDKPGMNEDALIGVSLFGQIEFNHDPRYAAFRTENGQIDPLASNDIIVTHKCLPPVMRQVHNAYLESFKNV